MGLELTFTESNTGLNLVDAYHKIMKVDIVNNDRVSILVGTYTAQGQTSSIRTKEFSIYASNDDPQGSEPFADNFSIAALDAVDANLIKNAYNYLKTLAEYNGASDVLEV
jgi:hypothetical protein